MPRQIRNALIVIALGNLLLTLGFGLWQNLFNNFAVEELGIRADQMGLIQAIREVPGLLGFLVGILALVMAEMRIAGVSMLLMGVGISLTASAHSPMGLIGATLLMSTGFHFFAASNSAAVMLTVGPDETPKMLGRLNSLGALAMVVGTVFILVALNTMGYRALYQVTGIVVVVGGLALLPFGRQPVRVVRKRGPLPLRRRYWLYYTLQFLLGSRRHIFTTFAAYLLVKDYQVTAQTITLLYLVNNLVATYCNQAFGKIVARYGERRVLTVNFILLLPVFVGYVVIPTLRVLETPTMMVPALGVGGWQFFPSFPVTPGLLVLMGLFLADNILFGLSIALESYLQKIALSPEDITPNVSLGQTFNHIAAVIIPVVGGILWERAGSQYTFMIGVVIALVLLALARRVRT